MAYYNEVARDLKEQVRIYLKGGEPDMNLMGEISKNRFGEKDPLMKILEFFNRSYSFRNEKRDTTEINRKLSVLVQ